MAEAGASPSTAPSDPLDEPQLLDLTPLWELAAGVLEACGRRPVLTAAVFVISFGAILGVVALFPRSYHTETRIQAQRNLVMPSLGNPRRAVPIDSDTPTRAVSETILTRENLLSLIEKVGLEARWEAESSPTQRFKVLTLGRWFPLSEAEKLDALVGLLEHRLQVSTDDVSVTIGIDWQNPRTAYDLVRQAQDNFLEARHATEVSTIAETISILEHHANDARAAMEQALAQLDKARAAAQSDAEATAVSTGVVVPRPRPVPARLPGLEAELTDLRQQLESTRQQISALDAEHERKVGELTAQLAQQRAVYASAHPALLATEQSLKALESPSPKLSELHAEERDLVDAIQRAQDEAHNNSAPLERPRATAEVPEKRATRRSDDDSRFEYPKTQLKLAADNYEDLLRRIDAAKIELDTAQAAFKYRYRVIRPAEIPERVSKPKPVFVLAGAFLASLALAVGLALLVDRRGGFVRSRRELERRLGLPVLGELERE